MSKRFKEGNVSSYTVTVQGLSKAASVNVVALGAKMRGTVIVKPVVLKGGEKK